MTKYGEGGIDAEGNYFHREWEDDETEGEFMARMTEFFRVPSTVEGSTLEISTKVYQLLKGISR